MRLVQTFIVRIYRNAPDGALAGTVERVRNGKAFPFHDFQELRSYLGASQPGEGGQVAGEANPTNRRRMK